MTSSIAETVQYINCPSFAPSFTSIFFVYHISEQSISDRIQRRQFKWYGHHLRLEDSRWPKKIYLWTLHGRRKRERPQKSCKNQGTDFMRNRNLEEDMTEDRHL
jgi:hypothetical protein